MKGGRSGVEWRRCEVVLFVKTESAEDGDGAGESGERKTALGSSQPE